MCATGWHRVTFSERRSLPDFVEGEGCSGDVADPTGTECDVLKGASSLLEFGGGAFSEGSHVPDHGVEHADVDVKCLFGLHLWAADGDELPMPAPM